VDKENPTLQFTVNVFTTAFPGNCTFWAIRVPPTDRLQETTILDATDRLPRIFTELRKLASCATERRPRKFVSA
jgi:hypothetical protein